VFRCQIRFSEKLTHNANSMLTQTLNPFTKKAVYCQHEDAAWWSTMQLALVLQNLRCCRKP